MDTTLFVRKALFTEGQIGPMTVLHSTNSFITLMQKMQMSPVDSVQTHASWTTGMRSGEQMNGVITIGI